MPRLIPLTDERGTTMAWINPEHIVSLRPIVTKSGGRGKVLAEVKLVGLPAERFVVSADCAEDELDSVWTAFVAELAGPAD